MLLSDHIKEAEVGVGCREIYNPHRILIESLKRIDHLETAKVEWRVILKKSRI
jgi:hypothetical protein